ncbi:hypothetical protein [Ornithinibacillus xuwenensis]|jgi:hypothetical protein|uniref:Lipoprotein n=1 Tax=Ornithinibacillus xuwenensis TaxID=3144668 RepID=A0ABU9XGW3_9BACI
MKKILEVIGFFMILGLVACGSSPEGDALAEYHNNYVENVNSLASQVDVEVQKSFSTESPEETYKLQTENVLPLIKEVKEHIESMAPESKVVKEIHELRLEQLTAWEEAFDLQYEALEKTIAAASEGEVNDLLTRSDQKLVEAAEFGQKADERLLELAEEHNVTLE